jgi:uncharacterized protein YndB with AHSA1/START domain
VPTARATRTIAAPADELWQVLSDPHHLPRWWPRVTRVEDVEGDAFTEVMKTAKGRFVRADFKLVDVDEGRRGVRWSQRVEGTPFARVLKSADTEVWLRPVGGDGDREPTPDGQMSGAATEVTIELRQSLSGFFPRFGGFMVRRAAASTLEQALDGLERISG